MRQLPVDLVGHRAFLDDDHDGPRRLGRNGRHIDIGKLVRAELYDLQKDPAESVNRINEAAYKGAATELEAIRKGGWKPVRERVGR